MKFNLSSSKLAALALAVSATSASLAVGPTSTLYASRNQEFGVQSGLDRIQVPPSIPEAPAASMTTLSPFTATSASPVTTSAHSGTASISTDSLPGGPYSDTYAADPIFDGTSDGNYNYGLGYFGSTIIRYDRNWNNATPLFTLLSGGTLHSGISMNTADGSFWVSEFAGGSLVEHYSAGGAWMGQFNTGITGAYGLAFDSADGTLWLNDVNNPFTLTQFDQLGNQLQSANYGVGGRNWFGMEFNTNTAVPEPASMAALGMAAVALIRRRKRA